MFPRVCIAIGVFLFSGHKAFSLGRYEGVFFHFSVGITAVSCNIFSWLFSLLTLGHFLESVLLFFDPVALVSVYLLFGRIWWVLVFYASEIPVQAEAAVPIFHSLLEPPCWFLLERS